MAQIGTDCGEGIRSVSVSPTAGRRLWFSVGIGNFIEWFDFAIYGYLATIIAEVFFPPMAPGMGLLSALAVFAVGFVSRPLGAFLLGPIGDRYGRKTVLVITVCGMGLVTGLIGLLPGYGQIGIASPILLIVLRFLQGTMVGGEWSSAGIYIVESAAQERRALAASLVTATAALAFVAGMAAAASLSWALSQQAMISWGWRIPFLASFLLMGLGLHMRRELAESPVYAVIANRRRFAPVAAVPARQKWTSFAVTFAFSAVFGVSLYYLIAYLANHLIQSVGVTRAAALWTCAAALALSAVLHPLIGFLSDRWGRRPFMLGASLGLAVFGYPLFLMLDTADLTVVFSALAILAVLVAVAAVMNVVLLVEVFPASVRSTHAALGYNLALAVVAGPSPFIAAALVHWSGRATAAGWHLSLVALVCFLVLLFTLPETRRRDIYQG